MRRSAVFLGLMCALILLAAPALTDDTLMGLSVDPPEPLAGESKTFRMKAERIRIHFSLDETRVEAEFDLENLSDRKEMTRVGFPDDSLVRAYMKVIGESEALEKSLFGYYDYRELDKAGVKPYRNFKTWIGTPYNSLETKVYKREQYESLKYQEASELAPAKQWKTSRRHGEVTLWHTFELRFKPCETLTVGHTYTADNGGHGVGWGQPFFVYLLATGKNWAGTIGRAEIDVFLKDGLTIDDLVLDEYASAGYNDPNPKRDGWEIVSPTHLRLVWEDFEPVDEKAYVKVLAHTTIEMVKRGSSIEGLPDYDQLVELGVAEPRF